MHFRYFSYLFIFCGIIVCSTSCKTTSVVTISVYNPAKVKLPDSLHNITLVNGSNIINESSKNSNTNAVSVINDLAQQSIFTGIKDVFYQYGITDTVTIARKSSEENHSVDFETGSEPMKWDTIKAITFRNKSDVLISLDSLGIDHSYSTTRARGVYTSNSYNRTGRLNICLSALFSVYDNRKNRLIDEHIYNDTIFWEEEGKSIYSLLWDLPGEKNAISEAAYWSGRYYAERFISRWEEVDRFYYVRGGPEMREASELVKEEKWMDAAKIWKDIVYEEDDKIASRAAFNMAIVSEMYDNLEAALNWAKKSNLLDEKEPVQRYIKILQDRIRIYEKYLRTYK